MPVHSRLWTYPLYPYTTARNVAMQPYSVTRMFNRNLYDKMYVIELGDIIKPWYILIRGIMGACYIEGPLYNTFFLYCCCYPLCFVYYSCGPDLILHLLPGSPLRWLTHPNSEEFKEHCCLTW
jgi:hypothetical protein